jgi:methyl-accepting chemotaxis protein
VFAIFQHRDAVTETLPELQPCVPVLDSAQPVREEIARHLPLLQVLGKQIRDTAQQVEQAVVEVCSTFQNIAEEAGKGVNRAAEFLSGQDHQATDNPGIEALINRSQTTFDSLLNTLAREAEISEQAIQRMKEIDGYAEKIASALKQVEGIADGNRLLALNARIEAARAGEFGKGFEVVATEVVAQADRSQSVISGVSHTIHELRSSASSALKDLEEMSDKGLASAEAERQQVKQTLQSFNDLDVEMRTMLKQSTQDGERLSKEISTAINRMQFQDRVNQRLDHVALALNDSQQRLANLCENAAPSDMSLMNEILDRYTMHEEREAADRHETEAGSGDVELF